MKIWMSNSSFLKQLGSAGSGQKFTLSKRVPTCWCRSFGALRYPYNALCSFQTSSSHNSDFSGGCANNSWSMSACRSAVCASIANCDVVTAWVIGSIMRASQQCFQRQCRWCRCKHLGLSAPLVTMEVLQNQTGLHAPVLLSIDPSRLYHSFASR